MTRQPDIGVILFGPRGAEKGEPMQRSSRRRTPVMLAGLLALATALAACGSSGSSKSSSDTKGPASTTPQTAAQTTDLGQGVTADTVKVGIVLIDYESIAQFID